MNKKSATGNFCNNKKNWKYYLSNGLPNFEANFYDFEKLQKKTENCRNYIRSRSIKNTKPLGWSLENGYPDEDKMDTFPRRTFLSGISGGFLFDIFTNHSHLDYMCGESLQGFKVYKE